MYVYIYIYDIYIYIYVNMYQQCQYNIYIYIYMWPVLLREPCDVPSCTVHTGEPDDRRKAEALAMATPL